MTDAIALMREWFPRWTDQERHDVLLNCTAYPCGGEEVVTEQLQALRAKADAGATPDELIAEVEREMEAAMHAWREEQGR